MNSKILAANINTTGEARIDGKIVKSVVVTVGGRLIGIIGFLTWETSVRPFWYFSLGSRNVASFYLSINFEIKLIFLGHFKSRRRKDIWWSERCAWWSRTTQTARRQHFDCRRSRRLPERHGNSREGARYWRRRRRTHQYFPLEWYVQRIFQSKQKLGLNFKYDKDFILCFFYVKSGVGPSVEGPKGAYPTMVKQPSCKIVPVVQAYAFGKYLGNLMVTFNDQGEVIASSGSPIFMDNKIPQGV